MAEPEETADRDLTAAVEHYIEQMGWVETDMMLTDVLVVAVRRGFDTQGGKSITTTVVPTDSAVPLLLGMSRYAELRFEKIVSESFTDLEED